MQVAQGKEPASKEAGSSDEEMGLGLLEADDPEPVPGAVKPAPKPAISPWGPDGKPNTSKKRWLKSECVLSARARLSLLTVCRKQACT